MLAGGAKKKSRGLSKPNTLVVFFFHRFSQRGAEGVRLYGGCLKYQYYDLTLNTM